MLIATRNEYFRSFNAIGGLNLQIDCRGPEFKNSNTLSEVYFYVLRPLSEIIVFQVYDYFFLTFVTFKVQHLNKKALISYDNDQLSNHRITVPQVLKYGLRLRLLRYGQLTIFVPPLCSNGHR